MAGAEDGEKVADEGEAGDGGMIRRRWVEAVAAAVETVEEGAPISVRFSFFLHCFCLVWLERI